MNIRTLALGAAFACLAFAAGAQTAPNLNNLAKPGIDLAGMDAKIKPGDDFFAYANGAWMASTEIPADRSQWGISGELQELTSARVADIIKTATAAPRGSEAAKVGDFYTAYMDEARIEAAGLSPLKPVLDRIAAIKDKTGLAAELGLELRADVDALNATDLYTDHLFGLWVEQDLNNPKRYAPYLMQGGLGMVDRDYYLVASPRMDAVRA